MQKHRRSIVKGLLIADEIRPSDERIARDHQTAGILDIRTWENLLITTQTLHSDFLDIVRQRAPRDDPRISLDI